MANNRQQKFFFISLASHLVVFLFLVLGFDFASPIPVIENTNKNDVISAVVLGDTAKSKILPKNFVTTKIKNIKQEKPDLNPPKIEVKPIAISKKIEQKIPEIKKDVIALKQLDKKKIVAQKINEQQDLFAKDLLADIKNQSEHQKKTKQKALKSKFEKTLREQSELSLRQQLLNEEIKLKGTLSREAQGVVNKYQALIIQAISEHWIVPPSTDKKLYCVLMIHLAPSGAVLNVEVIKTSGDLALDRSARAAVFKASPLPVPSDPAILKTFTAFTLKVKPENVLSNDV